MSREKERKRVERYLGFLKEHYPVLTIVTSTTLIGAGALILFLRRRTKEGRIIDQIANTFFSDPEEIGIITRNLGEAAILPLSERLAEKINELPEPQKGKLLRALEEASGLSRVPPGTSTTEGQITSIAAKIADEIERIRESSGTPP